MTLKTKEVEVEGRKIHIHELTLENQFNLEEKGHSLQNFYQECMSEDDFKFCKTIPFRVFVEKVGNEITKINAIIIPTIKGDKNPLPENSQKTKTGE